MNVRTSYIYNATTNSTNAPYSGEFEANIFMIDLNNCELLYKSYAFFQSSIITSDNITSVACLPKTYLKVD